jgi:hypothetical protein
MSKRLLIWPIHRDSLHETVQELIGVDQGQLLAARTIHRLKA